jgi:hypothetical protein
LGDRRIGLASASFQWGAGHAWSEITHAQDVLRLTAADISSRHIALSLSIGARPSSIS